MIQFEIPEKVASSLKTAKVQQYSPDHCKVAYLISLYGQSASGPTVPETWIRQHPLWVYLFECIVAGALEEPDYAPASVLISQDGFSSRVWLNITQEGKALVDELREHTFLNGLKLSSSGGQPVTCFQISDLGKEFLKVVPQSYKDQIDAAVYGPPGCPRTKENLLNISFDSKSREFILSSNVGYSINSTITETEDVSYVSSSYLPSCLRSNNTPMKSNAHRRDECANSASSVQTEQNNVITLGNVSTMVCEWVPYGANQIVALNERLGALDRCQGGFFTNVVDKEPTDTGLEIPQGITNVSILDFDFVRFTNFAAEIGFAVEEGVIQIEEFGMHISIDGSLMYGMFIEAIMSDHAEALSVDDLTRVLVDVHKDSSEIMNDILSEFQRKILDMIYMGDMLNRGKFNVLMANKIDPLLDGNKYMDRSERELELKQILGDILSAKRIGNEDVVLLGREGLLYAGAESKNCEALLVNFSFLLAKEQFVRNFFVRMFILDDQILNISQLISAYDQDPNRIFMIRKALNKGSQDIILLEQTLNYLLDSLNSNYGAVDLKTAEPIVVDLAEALEVEQQLVAVKLRANDMKKLVKGAGNKLAIQRQQSSSITTKLVAGTVNNIDANYTSLVGAAAADERAAVANNIMNLIFAGSFCFDVIDRLTGDDQLGFEGVDCGGLSVHWIYEVVGFMVSTVPLLWCFCNITALLGGLKGLDIFMSNLLAKTVGAQGHRQRLNIKIVDTEKLQEYLKGKTLIAIDTVIDPDNLRNTVKTAWEETDAQMWSGEPPKVTLEYDPGTNFLLQMNLQWNEQRQKGDKNQLVRIFLEDMVKKGCVTNTCTSSNGLLKLNLIDKVQYERMQFIENDHHDDEEEGNGEGSNKTSSKYSYKED
jgi:hypothetical protein